MTRGAALGRDVDWRGLAAGVPREALAHARGTDAEQDVAVLYAVAVAARPTRMVELGTRQGVTARTLAAAGRAIGAALVCIDPAPCGPYLDGLGVEFIQARAEDVFAARRLPAYDFVFVDVDPHTYTQTRQLCDSWAAGCTPTGLRWTDGIAPGGVLCFHDVCPPPGRPEIQVREAVEHWCRGRPGWSWQVVPGTSGIGILTAPS